MNNCLKTSKDNNTYMKFTYLFLFMFIISFTMVSAETYKVNTPVDLQLTCTVNYQVPSAAATYNLSVYYPNGSALVLNKAAAAQGQGSFNYNLTFPIEGTYKIKSFCYDTTGNYSNEDLISITFNGNPSPEGFVIVLFVLAFLGVIGFMSSLIITNIGHFAQLDYDIEDLMKNISMYFVLIALYLLELQYLGNAMMDTILVWALGIAGFTNVAVSFLAFIFSHLKKVMEQKIKLEDY